jgi:two-component system sensor histidine kinase ChvG
MAVETDGSRFAAGAWETLKRGLATWRGSLAALAAGFGKQMHRLGAVAQARVYLRQTRAYGLLTTGPLIRFISRTLQRRIIFANTIGLAILLGGIFYLSQYHAWLIDAKRESLRAQGDIIAAAIAANASIETGRLVLDPDRLPELEGARSPFRDDGFAALQLSIAPERVTPILRRLLPSADTRARVYAQDGTLIIDTAQLLARGQLARGTSAPAEQQDRVRLKNGWTRFLAWLMRGDLPVYREIGGANGKAYPEVRMALGGSVTPMLLLNEKGEQIVSMAVPIQFRKAVQGVLLL